MVLLDLVVKIISENVQELRVDPSTYQWTFTVECSHCFSIQPNEIYFTQSDEVEMQKGHGVANFIMKCKECKKSMSIGLNDKSKFNIQCENGNDEGVLASFDCRGCKLVKWIINEGIIIEAKDTGTLFEDVNVNEMWCEYDEKSQMSVSLLEPVEYRFKEQ